MIFENFQLVTIKNQQTIEIDYLGQIIDLHNASEFLKIIYTIRESVLTLFWNYYSDNKVMPFQIIFKNVNYLKILPRDTEMPREEDDCLEEIFYNEKLEFKFMGGAEIVVGAEKVRFEKV